jgi:chemotaxis response regulator CheB
MLVAPYNIAAKGAHRRSESVALPTEQAMSAKQTRESIEAELNASERERIVQQICEVIQENHEVEKDLRALEDANEIPESDRSKPLLERMAAVGMSQAGIAQISTLLDALKKFSEGRIDEVPEHVKSELADRADAELSGAEQLAAIVGLQRKG